MPLEFNARSFAEAWSAFQTIPFLSLGVDSRADWVANGVLYVPVGFLTAHLLAQNCRKTPTWLSLVVAGVFAVGLAVTVEFVQLFYPPRTVSLNDLLAECIGAAIGLAASARFSGWFQTLYGAMSDDPQRWKRRVIDGYAFAYLAFSFFPYDLLLSWPELEAKFYSDTWGWFIAGHSAQLWHVGLQFVAEIALTLPFGILLARVSGVKNVGFRSAALVGVLLGGAIEGAQLLLYSGVSQGLSVLARAVGVCAGVAFLKYRGSWTLNDCAAMVKRRTLPLGAAYLLALMGINGWFVSSWHGVDTAAAKLTQVRFTPFYYHYFTSEAKALFSLLAVTLSYTPIAVLAWARQWSPRFAGGMALFVATGIEASKLFFNGPHPDPSNLLIAYAATWFVLTFMNHLAPLGAAGNSPATGSSGKLSVKSVPAWLVLCLTAAGAWLITFPVYRAQVGLVLILCGVLIWYRPSWVFVIIPAALPVFDLAPWSGRFFLDEFDALLLVGLAIAYARVPAPPLSKPRRDVLFSVTVTLLGLSFVIATARGLLPFQYPDANSFNTYYSPYNALRIVKGAFWAVFIYKLSSRFAATGIDVHRPFAWGLTLGLGLTVAFILWERVAYSGLWNFGANYRVTGPFSAMHTGGAYIECFLAVATPFLIFFVMEKGRWSVKFAGVLLLMATTYALMVTFSRNGYLAFGIAVVLALFATLIKSSRLVRTSLMMAGLVGAVLWVAAPVFEGSYAQSRMATVRADLAVRQAHWQDALDIRDADWATSLFGMGIGRFPETSYWRSAINPRSGTYRVVAEADNTYLRLGAGDSIYVEQLVAVIPGQRYTLSMDVRAYSPGASITMPICEKWLLTSYNCAWNSTKFGKESGKWQTIEIPISTDALLVSPWYSQRPIKLSLYDTTLEAPIDIDNVRLRTANGANLLANGDFSRGLDHWFYSTDGHLQWHLKSLYFGTIFDQGWFGLLALSAFLALALIRTAKKTVKGDALAGATLAALCAFAVVGLFDTLIDAPRFLLLLLVLATVKTKTESPQHS